MEFKRFNSKQGTLEYLLDKFKNEKLIVIRGSAAKKPLKEFSDIDVEVWAQTIRKPVYEIVFVKNKPILLSIYTYKYAEGEALTPPENVLVLKGEYNREVNRISTQGFGTKDRYTPEENKKRECQMVVDFMFKYLRHGKTEYLKSVQKRI